MLLPWNEHSEWKYARKWTKFCYLVNATFDHCVGLAAARSMWSAWLKWATCYFSPVRFTCPGCSPRPPRRNTSRRRRHHRLRLNRGFMSSSHFRSCKSSTPRLRHDGATDILGFLIRPMWSRAWNKYSWMNSHFKGDIVASEWYWYCGGKMSRVRREPTAMHFCNLLYHYQVGKQPSLLILHISTQHAHNRSNTARKK